MAALTVPGYAATTYLDTALVNLLAARSGERSVDVGGDVGGDVEPPLFIVGAQARTSTMTLPRTVMSRSHFWPATLDVVDVKPTVMSRWPSRSLDVDLADLILKSPRDVAGLARRPVRGLLVEERPRGGGIGKRDHALRHSRGCRKTPWTASPVNPDPL